MRRMGEALMGIPRPWLYTLVFLAAALPFFLKKALPVDVTPEVRKVYEFVESLPPGTPILLSTDYGPSSMPELQPTLEALLTQAFRKNLRVVVMTHTTYQGIIVAQMGLDKIARKMGKRYGTDYVLLGYRPGAAAVIINMGKDIRSVFDTDINGTPLDSLPALQGVKTLSDFGLVVSLAATAAGDFWVIYGQSRYHFPLALASTAVLSPGHYLYYNAGQVVGLIPALKGASEYEHLVGLVGPATLGMTSQAAVHAFLLLLIFVGNLGYFMARRWAR